MRSHRGARPRSSVRQGRARSVRALRVAAPRARVTSGAKGCSGIAGQRGYVMKVRGRLAALKHELDPHQGCEVRNRPRVKSFLILSRPHRLFARVLFRIAVEKFANQALVLRVVSARLGLEELEARATEEHRDPDLLLPGSRGSRQEVGEDAKCAKRFTGDLVIAHGCVCLSAGGRPKEWGAPGPLR
jgi:hypothetical protein